MPTFKAFECCPAAPGEDGHPECPARRGISTQLGAPPLMETIAVRGGKFCGDGSQGTGALEQRPVLSDCQKACPHAVWGSETATPFIP